MDFTTSQRSPASPGLVRAPSRLLAFEAWGLTLRTGFVARPDSESGAPVSETRILGEARLARDLLGRSGAPDEAGTMPFAIRPMPDGGSQRMLLMLGHGGESEDFHIGLWLPAEVFAAVRADLEAGRIGHVAFAATTNLWIAGSQEHAPAQAQVTWLLGREDDDTPQSARGLVERIDWSEALLSGTGDDRADPSPEQPIEASEDGAETTAEVLERVNWSLKQIALVLVFLLIVVALK